MTPFALLARHAPCTLAALMLAACAPAHLSPLERNHPLAGRIWDTRSANYVAREALIERARAAPLVILGEVHDNTDHHRLQAEVLAAMVQAGRTPALAMEQFDREHQGALDAARARGERDAERVADAGRFDRKGWGWAHYRPLVEFAVATGLPILAANLSREDARALMKSGRAAEGFAPATAAQRAALEQDIIDGHCGHRPTAPVLAGMVEAQRARDAQMASVLARTDARGAVLIAGAGHARRDRGVPAYLAAGTRDRILAIAFVEVESGRMEPGAEFTGLFDLVWFTPRAAREDPCKNLRMP